MIIFYHNQSIITEVVSTEAVFSLDINDKNIVSALFFVADKFKDEILVWCHENEKENLNISEIKKLFHHKKIIVSYNSYLNIYLNTKLGYIEDTTFIQVNKKIKYATWQMSSQVGAVHSTVINACKNDLKKEDNFDYFLNSFAKRALPYGLFCYSEPRLLKVIEDKLSKNTSNISELFRFTKQHYKTRWVFLLFLNLFLFEKKFPLYPFVRSFFYRKRKFNPEKLNGILIESNKKIIENGTIDVLIPTIGRKNYLLSVLENLERQTYLPKNVIIIEQNPQENSVSDLDFIQNKKWSFVIKHHFTHQTGACNARNIGLQLIESEFTFFADDDIVFENDLIENAMQVFQLTGNEIFHIACLLETQKLIPQTPKQFPFFGAGHAFVKSICFDKLHFNMAYEYGFGEDNDFGMQMRNKGYDILYISTSRITHLKAPIGGFRTKPVLKWQNESIQPKPSPTVMLFRLKFNTKEQLKSYKVVFLINNLNIKVITNPVGYLKEFKKKWNKSVFWANKLNKEQL